MRKIILALSALFLSCAALPASAQQPVVPSYSTTGNPPFSPVTPTFGLPVICESGCAGASLPNPASTGTAPLSVSSSSSRVALGDTSGNFTSLIVSNDGSTGLYFNLGNSSVTATTSNQYLAPGRAIEIGQNGATDIAAITSTSTSTLSVTQLSGAANIAGGGSGSGSSSNASVGATGSSVPASATYVGITSGGNLTGWTGAVTQGTSPWVDNVSTWAGGTLGAMANYGTSPGAVLVPGVNASVTASALPTGAATSANQSTEISSLATIATNSGLASNLAAAATGGCTAQTIFSAASNNATVIGGAAAHTLCFVRWENTGTNLYSIRFYDTATAPSAGAPCNSATNLTSADVAQSNATSPGGVANNGPFGQSFASGIVVCITGANANNDNTNASTGLNLIIGFK